MSGAAIGEYPLCIDTPDGPVTVTAAHETVICDDEVQRASVTLHLSGTAYAGHGSDTEYALYDLEKRLPEGCTLRCCLSCRHGHFCPVGDADNEVFCVTDFEPRTKSDLYHVTEDEQERATRSRTLFHLCDGWQAQSEETYTYTSYLEHTKRGHTNEKDPDLAEA